MSKHPVDSNSPLRDAKNGGKAALILHLPTERPIHQLTLRAAKMARQSGMFM